MGDWKQRFYQSKPWKQMRTRIIHRDKGVCAYCGEVIVGSPYVHHTVKLTEENYTNPEISLNPALLQTLHGECHDKIHGRFGLADKVSIVGEDLEIDYSKRW